VLEQVVSIAREFDCADRVHQLLSEALTKCVNSVGHNRQSQLFDAAACLRDLLHPIAVEISRQR
jgi:hypothetical protein